MKKMDKEILKRQVLTVEQLAEYLQVDKYTIYRLAKKGKIPATKVAGQWRFMKELIDKWLIDNSIENLKGGSEGRPKNDREI